MSDGTKLSDFRRARRAPKIYYGKKKAKILVMARIRKTAVAN